jgi:hypothetical protein
MNTLEKALEQRWTIEICQVGEIIHAYMAWDIYYYNVDIRAESLAELYQKINDFCIKFESTYQKEYEIWAEKCN